MTGPFYITHCYFQTYAVDRDGTDSAASATAYLCGVKGNYHTAGVSGKVTLNDCESYENGKHNVQSVLVDAYEKGTFPDMYTILACLPEIAEPC